MSAEALERLARRAADPQYDARHAILDISDELRALRAEAAWPPELQAEFRALVREIESVQPVFPSQRRTSVLFDRAGMGQPGLERAQRLVRRLVSLSRSVPRDGEDASR